MKPDANLTAYVGLAVLGLVTLANWAGPPDGPGCVVGYVYDGDTVELLCEGRVSTARLVGLDAPELTKPRCETERQAAQAARHALAGLVQKADRIDIIAQGHDRYGRDLVALVLDGTDVAEAMVAQGHARRYDGGQRDGWCR